MKTCRNCRFVKDVGMIDVEGRLEKVENGWCYRWPPVIVNDVSTYVPVRPYAPGCGEWRWRGVIALFKSLMGKA